MPSIRIGFSTDFNLTNEQVGIGTTFPTARLDVRGQILSDNLLGSGGVSTVTRYDGFLSEKQVLAGNITISQTGKGNLNSLSGEIVIENEVTVTEGTPLTGGRLDSLTVTGGLDIPQGGTLSRSATPEKGSTRFNSDLGQLEFYTGTEWRTVGSFDGSGRGRGVFAGTFGNNQTIGYVNISSIGNATNFGRLSSLSSQSTSTSSSIRGVFGGSGPAGSNVLEYITIASEGNAIYFGDLVTPVRLSSGVSSSTRGIYAGGTNPNPATPVLNVIEYITISTIGNALDFGDLTVPRRTQNSGVSSPTRGVFLGGNGGPSYVSVIDFITIASTGNAVNFGGVATFAGGYRAGCSNSIRGVFSGGYANSLGAILNLMDYITIATNGNALYFGDLTFKAYGSSACSNSTRALFAGGITPSLINTINYVTIASTGNAIDFGDLTIPSALLGACSDSHGGLGGF